ncbi:MAG: 50S ribosomal protein L10 [Candidatus Nanoarchaeia archaeon]
MAHVSQAKKDAVAEYVDLINSYDMVGAVNLENLPAKQLNVMRTKLRKTVLVKMNKRRIMKVALEQSKKEGLTDLEPYLKGMPALLFSNDNPFTLFKTLKKNKSTAAIKAGQIAPNDIVVTAGPTSFAPGPIIGELGAVGIKAGIEGGKVAIKQDTVVAKEGDEISEQLAGILSRLEIEPMKIGLDLTAVCENGEILTKAVLDIDEDAYYADLSQAASWAFNLAMQTAYPCEETIIALVTKAFSQSISLALDQDILTDLTVGDTLIKAHNQMLGVAGVLPEDALSDALKSAQATVSAQAAAPEAKAPAEEEKKEDNNKEEKKDDGAAAAGLGALFG